MLAIRTGSGSMSSTCSLATGRTNSRISSAVGTSSAARAANTACPHAAITGSTSAS
ncbi:MAG: hypothetical protein QM809_03300 [Gordonia sp. (in: high G+C Gram-positive bacteria)]|uniref:hypothetical protein n=1 Tax=Gordonia sp. (in: high G+C Gram-positive bacteria) TaxID=84139 RepID=UPI0039E72324